MAERRMFSKTIIDSDKFLDMPLSTQTLYFHLGLRADDDGFLNNGQKIIRMVGCSREDYNLLIQKEYLIEFDGGIIVITHWKIHNYIRNDRYKPTIYQKEYSLLSMDESKAYQKKSGIPDGYNLDTQDRLVQSSLGEDSLEKDKVDDHNIVEVIEDNSSINKIIDKWNSLNFIYKDDKVYKLNDEENRNINKLLISYDLSEIVKAIENIEKSEFLRGKNNSNWQIMFKWFIEVENFKKVLNGFYSQNSKNKKDKYSENNHNTFKVREYNYELLEKQLLNWA